MKVLVLLSLVALCASQSAYLGNHVTVGRDGSIAIVGGLGREIYIYKNVVYPTKVDMVLKSPYGPTRKIEIDQTNNIHNVDVNNWNSRYYSTWRYINDLGNDYTQYDILVYLFGHCQGLVGLEQYHNLIEKINYLVQKQVLHKTIWDVLKYFDNYYYQQGVSDFDNYIPYQEAQAVGQYGYNTLENLTPEYPEYQNAYGRSYESYQVSPLSKVLNYLNQQVYKGKQGQQLVYPYSKQYQTPLNYQQVYPQGYYYQREYPQGYYQQEYPQGYYQSEYPQGYYQREYPQGYYQNQQYPQQWWNRQQYSLY